VTAHWVAAAAAAAAAAREKGVVGVGCNAAARGKGVVGVGCSAAAREKGVVGVGCSAAQQLVEERRDRKVCVWGVSVGVGVCVGRKARGAEGVVRCCLNRFLLLGNAWPLHAGP
jgi:hypothetical protein